MNLETDVGIVLKLFNTYLMYAWFLKL